MLKQNKNLICITKCCHFKEGWVTEMIAQFAVFGSSYPQMPSETIDLSLHLFSVSFSTFNFHYLFIDESRVFNSFTVVLTPKHTLYPYILWSLVYETGCGNVEQICAENDNISFLGNTLNKYGVTFFIYLDFLIWFLFYQILVRYTPACFLVVFVCNIFFPLSH